MPSHSLVGVAMATASVTVEGETPSSAESIVSVVSVHGCLGGEMVSRFEL